MGGAQGGVRSTELSSKKKRGVSVYQREGSICQSERKQLAQKMQDVRPETDEMGNDRKQLFSLSVRAEEADPPWCDVSEHPDANPARAFACFC